MPAEIENQNGTWVFLAPISNLILTNDPTLRIVRCNIVRASSLPYCRKKIGLRRPLSEFKTRFIKSFFDLGKSYLTLRLTGVGKDVRPEFLKHCEDELYILASSQLGYGQRKGNGVPCISDQYRSGKVSFLLHNSNENSWTQPNYVVGHIMELVIDKTWHLYHKHHYFHKLLKILRGELKVEKQWKQTLYDASVLIGMSQCSSDLTTSFLWNMIAIEMLLTSEREKYAEVLPERAEAFLGWVYDWRANEYEDKIRKCYQKRCLIVHNGDRKCVTQGDLEFTDAILFNLLTNLIQHHAVFKGKNDIKQFSEKVKAEHLLGVKTTVRPKSLSFTRKKIENLPHPFSEAKK